MNAGYWDIFWPQFIQGASLALLFMLLTTVTMDPIPKEEMGNAASVFNLMRNIGGSMGIASVTTMLARREQVHINVLGSHVDSYNTGAQVTMENLRAGFIARGSDSVTATHRAHAALFGLVGRQAAMLSFNEVFWLLALFPRAYSAHLHHAQTQTPQHRRRALILTPPV